MSPGKHHNSETVLRVQRYSKMVAAELQYAEKGQIVGRHQQLVDVGISNVYAAEVRILYKEQQDFRSHS